MSLDDMKDGPGRLRGGAQPDGGQLALRSAREQPVAEDAGQVARWGGVSLDHGCNLLLGQGRVSPLAHWAWLAEVDLGQSEPQPGDMLAAALPLAEGGV